MTYSIRIKLLALAALAAGFAACKKEKPANPGVASIIEISNTPETARVRTAGQGGELVFIAPAEKGFKTSGAVFPYKLVFKGRIDAPVGKDGKPLSAVQAISYGGYYAASYMTKGDEFEGSIDVFTLQKGIPVLLSSVKIPDADITSIAAGDNKVFIGADLKTFESYGYESPAVVGIVDITNHSLANPYVVDIFGYSVKDLYYHQPSKKLYAASSTQGGLSRISLTGTPNVEQRFHFNYLRSLAYSNGKIIGSTRTEKISFDPNNLSDFTQQLWPTLIDDFSGRLNVWSDGNFLFGNSRALYLINKTDNSLIDEVEPSGFINSIAVEDNKIFVANGNGITVASVENSQLKVLAEANLYAMFPYKYFNVIGITINGSSVVAACGSAGVYVFELQEQ